MASKLLDSRSCSLLNVLYIPKFKIVSNSRLIWQRITNLVRLLLLRIMLLKFLKVFNIVLVALSLLLELGYMFILQVQ